MACLPLLQMISQVVGASPQLRCPCKRLCPSMELSSRQPRLNSKRIGSSFLGQVWWLAVVCVCVCFFFFFLFVVVFFLGLLQSHLTWHKDLYTARNIVVNGLINDGVADRRACNALLSPDYQYVGVAVRKHPSQEYVAVITLVQGVWEDK
jgi:hypothetical protein